MSQPTRVAIDIQRVNLLDLPQITCYFTVLDQAGRSRLGLTDQEVEISIDGVSQPVDRLTSALEGREFLSIVLLFDRSGSVRRALEQARNAAGDFVRRLSDRDRVGVITFDDRVSVDADLGSPGAALQAMDRIQAGRDTALYDALLVAFELLGKETTQRRAVIVLSDGKDTRSTGTLEQVAEEARRSGIAVYTVGIGDRIDEGLLREVARDTGGRFLPAVGPQDLMALYQNIAEQFQNQYLAVFTPTAGEDGLWHDIEITLRENGVSSAGRRYIATRGPGVAREVVRGIASRGRRRALLATASAGALIGLCTGLLLLLMAKLTRPELELLSFPSVGILVCATILGTIIGALVQLS